MNFLPGMPEADQISDGAQSMVVATRATTVASALDQGVSDDKKGKEIVSLYSNLHTRTLLPSMQTKEKHWKLPLHTHP